MSPRSTSIIERLEQAKRHTQSGAEYWFARDLQETLGYETWRRFEEALERATEALRRDGGNPSHHFVGTGKMMKLGKGAERQIDDYFLSRKACYLIAMNGDSSKKEIAEAQNYFALQTHRMEVEDQLPERERVAMRGKVRQANKALNEAAKGAGVERYGIFHDAGYRGLYDMGLGDLRKYKGIGESENPLDRAGLPELAANAFRITQTEQKITRERITGEQKAIDTHRGVGKQVRDTIKLIGGVMPENLKVEPPITEVARRLARRSLRLPKPKQGK